MLLRVPGLLYRFGLGSLLGHRFLQLTHTGRSSDWYQNVRRDPYVEVAVGSQRFTGIARELDLDAATALLPSSSVGTGASAS